MSFENWNLWIANRILSSVNNKGFISVVTKAERGYGKSMYNLKAMAYVYWSINGNNETDAWNSALDAMIFTPSELSRMVDYNIKNDISEKHDLAKKMPDKAAELQGMLGRWRKEMNAKMPAEGPRDDFETWKASRRQ